MVYAPCELDLMRSVSHLKLVLDLLSIFFENAPKIIEASWRIFLVPDWEPPIGKSPTWNHPFITKQHTWLVVSTPLKNISQIGSSSQLLGEIKNFPKHQPDTVDITT